MPNVYAQKMIEMMNRTGEPQTTTTTVTPPEQGLDLSALMTMLLMKAMQPKAEDPVDVQGTSAPASSILGNNLSFGNYPGQMFTPQSIPGGMTDAVASGASSLFTPELLMNILKMAMTAKNVRGM